MLQRLHHPSRPSGVHLGGAVPPGRFTAVDPRLVLAGITLLLVATAALTLWPLVAPLVLAGWTAHLTGPLFVRLSRALHGRKTAAAALTAALVLLVAAPLVGVVVALVPAARSLFAQLRSARGGKGFLAALVSGGGDEGAPGGLISMIKDYGASASKAIAFVAGASIDVLIGVFVFFATFFSLLLGGARLYAWLERNSPLEPDVFRRFAEAFQQAGRGLLVGTGLTALAQGACATAIYAALGIPRAMLLGLLSTVASLIPATGSTIVWVPVAAGLVFSGEPGKAVVLSILCLGVVGTVDNVLRPWLSERARVGIPGSVVLVAIFGGLVVFGPWGLLLGPLALRLAAEGLVVAREKRVFRRGLS
ncbi:MAG: AI-2E family transporter [Labilithrix sp.]|nr:AI-2E family transporter [Labilithrix sp.]